MAGTEEDGKVSAMQKRRHAQKSKVRAAQRRMVSFVVELLLSLTSASHDVFLSLPSSVGQAAPQLHGRRI